MNARGVRKRMRDMHITVKEMLRELSMDESTYYRKMQMDGAGFSAGDLLVFKRVLLMDEKTAYNLLLTEAGEGDGTMDTNTADTEKILEIVKKNTMEAVGKFLKEDLTRQIAMQILFDTRWDLGHMEDKEEEDDEL